jgi:hypothetical protein
MSRKFQVKRGAQANLPTLAEGEFGFVTDNKKLYIGHSSGNLDIPVGKTATATPTTTEQKDIIGMINEVKSYANDGKTSVATAINNKGVTAASTETFSSLAGKITSSLTKSEGTAVVGDVLSGKTFKNSTGSLLTGTMTNRGSVSGSITTQSGTYTVPAGYHSGSGKVTANITNLTAENIAKGVNVGGIVGTHAGSAVNGVNKTYPTHGGTFAKGDFVYAKNMAGTDRSDDIYDEDSTFIFPLKGSKCALAWPYYDSDDDERTTRLHIYDLTTKDVINNYTYSYSNTSLIAYNSVNSNSEIYATISNVTFYMGMTTTDYPYRIPLVAIITNSAGDTISKVTTANVNSNTSLSGSDNDLRAICRYGTNQIAVIRSKYNGTSILVDLLENTVGTATLTHKSCIEVPDLNPRKVSNTRYRSAMISYNGGFYWLTDINFSALTTHLIRAHKFTVSGTTITYAGYTDLVAGTPPSVNDAAVKYHILDDSTVLYNHAFNTSIFIKIHVDPSTGDISANQLTYDTEIDSTYAITSSSSILLTPNRDPGYSYEMMSVVTGTNKSSSSDTKKYYVKYKLNTSTNHLQMVFAAEAPKFMTVRDDLISFVPPDYYDPRWFCKDLYLFSFKNWTQGSSYYPSGGCLTFPFYGYTATQIANLSGEINVLGVAADSNAGSTVNVTTPPVNITVSGYTK